MTERQQVKVKPLEQLKVPNLEAVQRARLRLTEKEARKLKKFNRKYKEQDER